MQISGDSAEFVRELGNRNVQDVERP